MFVTPKQAAQLSLQTGLMMAEAQMVIAMRLWGMAGLWNTKPEENLRMVQEKAEAVLQSATRAGAAMMAASLASNRCTRSSACSRRSAEIGLSR